jgi:hypothetical protein
MYKIFPLQQLLWIDSIAALLSGCVVLVFTSSLNLPHRILQVMGIISLGYSAYSLSLAQRKIKAIRLLKLLVFANCAWVIVCLSITVLYRNTSTVYGTVYLLLEALFVGTLAILEWRQIKLSKVHKR